MDCPKCGKETESGAHACTDSRPDSSGSSRRQAGSDSTPKEPFEAPFLRTLRRLAGGRE